LVFSFIMLTEPVFIGWEEASGTIELSESLGDLIIYRVFY